jgi:hypothetical protein
MATEIDFSPIARLIAEAALASSFPPASSAPSERQFRATLDRIPIANDGDVITAEYFNALRETIAVIAASLDETHLERTITRSFTPVLLPVAGGGTPWRIALGFAAGPTSGSAAEGWMPLDLPNDVDVDTVTVRGKRAAKPTIWTASLRRLALDGSGAVDVCHREIQDATATAEGVFTISFSATTEGLTPAQIADRRHIDTSRYRYLFHSKFAGAAQADAVEIRLVQVTCTRG